MKKNKMLKIVGVLFLSLVIFFVGLFFFLTSNFFLAKVVIPQVSKTTGIPIKIEKISLSLFSGEIEIDKLMLGDTDDLRLSAEKIFLKTEILPLLSNKIVLDELKISNVKTSLIVDKNGKLKLPETKTISPKSKENKKTSTTALPKLNIRKIQINDVSIALIIEQNENPLKIIAENFSIKLNDLKNDGKKMFSFEFLSALKVTNADSLDINSKQIKITSKGILQEDFL
ncbi:MAG: AsmA family protein, partial [Verrucomicrobiota bacterium]|nr:AsmA family protein [Verrucomicrobiota bacterium]